jgi:hypothetical protein
MTTKPPKKPRAPQDDAVRLVTSYRRSIRALVDVVQNDPTLLAEAVTFWLEGGQRATGDDAFLTVLAASPNAEAFAECVLDVDADPDDGTDPTDRWKPEDWVAAAPCAAWWAAFSDSLSICCVRREVARDA